MLGGRFLDAARTLEKHLSNDDLEEHEEMVSLWLEVLLSAGEYERAYRDCSDKGFAFETLVDWLEEDRNARGLLRVAELHGEVDPGSAWIDATRGTAHLLLGNFAAAESAFLAAEDKENDQPESVDYFRSQRSRVQVAAGKGLELYRSEPTRAWFERIGHELEDAKKVAALRALVDAARSAEFDCLLYGVNQPAPRGVLFDVTSWSEVKRAALEAHASQVLSTGLIEKAEALGRAATINVS